MLKFTSEDDLLRLNASDPAYSIIKEFVQRLITEAKKSEFGYSPEADGYLVLLDRDDVNRPLTEIWGQDGYSLIDVPWEGVTRDESGEFFVCIFLANDQWGLVAILPDRDWLSGELRECIEAHLEE